MKKILLAVMLFCTISLDSKIINAQEAEPNFIQPTNLGIYLGGNVNMHSPNFLNPFTIDSLNPVTKNILFNETSNSLGLNIGLIFNLPIDTTFTFSGRIGYNGMGVDLTGNSKFGTTLLDTTLTSNNSFSLSYLEISSMIQFHNLLPMKRLYFLAGLELGIPIASTYSEETTTTFTDNITNSPISSNTTNKSDVEITDASFRLALGLGVGYTFDISDKVYLSPELSFRLPFTGVSSAANFDSWSVPQLRFGVNLTFGFGDDEKEIQKTADPNFQINKVNVTTSDDKGNKTNVDRVIIEDVQYSELYPLVPIVFFEANSAVPSEKTNILNNKTEVGEFNINNLESDALVINKNTLDILGKRLQENPSANLTITGTNDGNTEKTNKELAQKRAEFVRDYFVNNYQIDASRLRVNSQGLPTKPSALKDKDGVEENRRVEFSSNINDILAPIMIQKDKQTFATPLFVEFMPEITNEVEIDTWELTLEQSDKTLNVLSGTGDPSNMIWNISPNELKANEIPIDYTMIIKSKEGKVSKKIGTIPVEYYSYNRKKSEERPDKVISKYSLIVFDFDSPEISEFDKYILDKNVLPAIKSNSIVQIYGYSDRIGDEKYNQKLSTQRSVKVQEYLQSKLKAAKYETYGLGENIKIYNNDLTTGRQLSRTVQVYVITPKQ